MTTVEMTGHQIDYLVKSLPQLMMMAGKMHIKFSYPIQRNLKTLRDAHEALMASSKPSPEYEAFDNARMQLLQKYAKKDELGQPIQKAGNDGVPVVVISDENRDIFDKEIGRLRDQLGDAFTTEVKRQQDFNKFLGEKQSLDLHIVQFSTLPEMIDSRLLDAILPFLSEPTEAELEALQSKMDEVSKVPTLPLKPYKEVPDADKK